MKVAKRPDQMRPGDIYESLGKDEHRTVVYRDYTGAIRTVSPWGRSWELNPERLFPCRRIFKQPRKGLAE